MADMELFNDRRPKPPAPAKKPRKTAAQKRDEDHRARIDDSSDHGVARCKDCSKRITWNGPNHSDWSHA